MSSRPYNPFNNYVDLTEFVKKTDGVMNSRNRCPELDNSMQLHLQQLVKKSYISQQPSRPQSPFSSKSSKMKDQLPVPVNPISPFEHSGLDSRPPITDPFLSNNNSQSERQRFISNSSEDSENSYSLSTNHTTDSFLTGGASGFQQDTIGAVGNLSEVAQIVQQIVQQELRSTRSKIGCVFCKKNGETYEYFSTHMLKDNRGKVVCPILRKYTCPTCGATGDNAHTQRHCPYLNTRSIPRCSNPWNLQPDLNN